MGERITERRLIWRALVEAVQNLESIADAYSGNPDDPVRIEAKQTIKRINGLARKYFGESITESLNAPFKNAKLVSLEELRAQLRGEKPDVFVDDEASRP